MSGKKIIFWSSIALLIGAGVYFGIKQNNKAKAKKQAEDDAQAIIDAQNAAKNVLSQSKPKVVSKPTATAPPKPIALPVASLPKIGTKLYAAGDMNTYKTASAGASNVYKYFHKGDYIGTFLSGAGVPQGYYYKVLTQNVISNFGFDTIGNTEIYVIASQVKS